MEEVTSITDVPGKVTRPSPLRSSGSFKSSPSGRYTPRNSPLSRRFYSSRLLRRESRGGGLRDSKWFRGNRLLFLLALIALWAYIGFHVQSQWAHNQHNKSDFIGHNNELGSAEEVEDLIRVSDVNAAKSTLGDSIFLNGAEVETSKIRLGLSRKGRRISPRKNAIRKKNSKIMMMEHSQNSVPVVPNLMETENRTAGLDVGVARRNTSYGLLVGPFVKMQDEILGWSPDKRRGTCDRKGDFARLVWSRRFTLVVHDLSMTDGPLVMMELATELLSCGGTVTVVTLSRKGGLMEEFQRRGIKVMDNGELSLKKAMSTDLIIAGSTSCSPWIQQYFSRAAAGSSQILWWIMESEKEFFDKSKHLLNQVKVLTFLSESQSKQWRTWCEEEKIQLKAQPEVVHLSINDETAFAAGISCSLNTPSFGVEKMQEKKTSLRMAIRKEMGISDDDMLVLSLGSICPAKGQLLLLESALQVTEQNLSLIDVKINNLPEERNMSMVSIEDNKNQHGNRSIKLEADTLRPSTNKKKKNKRSKGKKSVKRQDARRKLLSSTKENNSSLKILIGYVGSKSNKGLYIKGMLRFLSHHSNLSKSLLWTPATTHVSSLYSAGDVYVKNTQGNGETFDRGTIEAMAYGLPVLGTDVEGIREIVQDSVTGLLHPVGREGIARLAQNINFLQSNPSAGEQLGKNGKLVVERKFMKHHMYKRLAQVFVQCMKIK